MRCCSSPVVSADLIRRVRVLLSVLRHGSVAHVVVAGRAGRCGARSDRGGRIMIQICVGIRLRVAAGRLRVVLMMDQVMMVMMRLLLQMGHGRVVASGRYRISRVCARVCQWWRVHLSNERINTVNNDNLNT